MPASANANSALILTLPSDREIVLTRVFHAPRRLVFEALSQPEHVLRWFGPRSCPIVRCEMDFRVGGAWRYVLQGPDGKPLGMRGVYREIQPPERLVSTESFDDYPCSETLNTLTLAEEGGKTTLTVRVLYPSKEVRDAVIVSGMEHGAGETYDRLEERLEAMARNKSDEAELITTRIFDAPRELVFRAWTDPVRLKRWWGPKGFTNPVCDVDVRPGGAIRIDMRGPDGKVYPMTGTYLEVVEPERLVFLSSALDASGEPIFEIRNVVTFAEEPSLKTKLTLHAKVMRSRPEAAPHLAGMEMGWHMTLDRLAAEVAGEEIV
jgi:uncharacterized protein YndB with AHSA1/START domain